MGGISFPKGKGNLKHNNRDYKENEWPENIDRSRTGENVTIKSETVAHAYHRIFDATLQEYNDKQKRADRKILNYRTHINNSKNGEKEFYEHVLQWGKKEDFEAHPELREVAKNCLEEYIKNFQERNPNLELIGAYIHMDEASPHLHFDYIPVAEGYKRGLSKRNSLDRAMREIIKARTGEDYKARPDQKDLKGKCNDNPTKQWKESERSYFRDICISRGLIVDQEKHLERDSLSPEEYAAAQDKLASKMAIKREELERDMLSSVQKMHDDFIQENSKLILENVRVKSENEKLSKVNSKLQEVEHSLVNTTSKLTQANLSLKTKKDELQNLETSKNSLKGQIQGYRTTLKELDDTVDAKLQQLDKLNSEVESKAQELSAMQIKLEELTRNMELLIQNFKDKAKKIFNEFVRVAHRDEEFSQFSPDMAVQDLHKHLDEAKELSDVNIEEPLNEVLNDKLEEQAKESEIYIRRRRGR